jgi:hypothetical protein
LARSAGTLELLAREFGRALEPLEQRLTAGQILDLFAELGLQFPPALTADAAFVTALGNASGAAKKISPIVAQLDAAIAAGNEPAVAAVGVQLLQQVKATVGAFDAIAQRLGALASSLGMMPADVTAFGNALPQRLLDYLIVTYLDQTHPNVANVLGLLGVVEHVKRPGVATDPAKPPYEERRLQLARLKDLVSSPADHLRNLYGWGAATFDGTALLPAVEDFAHRSGFPAFLQPATATTPQVLDLVALDVRVTSVSSPPGLSVTLTLPMKKFQTSFPVLRPGWILELAVEQAFASGVAATITPPGRISATTPAGPLGGKLSARLRRSATGATAPLVLLGKAGGTRFEATGVTLGAASAFTWDAAAGAARAEPALDASISGGRAVIALAGADSFIASLLPADGVQADLDVGVAWSPTSGLTFTGSGALETELMLHATVGPVTLEALNVALRPTASELQLEASITANATIGPLVASIQRLGATAALDFRPGNLGPIGFTVSFKPPRGLGIGVDVGPVVGGGFISFEPENGRYAGVLQLGIGPIQVKAIGLLDTKLPGGQPGYSFLIIISAEFPPIQLGFGFTLNGVGGLAGIQRTMVVDALQSGIRSGSVDHILFPEDPIRDAPQIVTALQTIFPPQQGRYVFGPMAIIGYGTPALVEAELGILLEVPAPVRLVVLGQISAVLPPKTEAGAAAEARPTALELHLDVLGVVDFGQHTVAIDAVLHDSKLTEFPLSGELALRASFGAEPAFAFAIGGFNPRFTPPPAFPALRRLMLVVSQNGNPQAVLQCYLALTSNSLQFGARGDLSATKLGFSFAGWLGFDVLVVISPLSFVADLTAAVEVKKGSAKIASVALEATLTGPTPWHLQGRASFDFVVRITVPIELTVGAAATAAIPPADPWPLLQAALEDRRNWRAVPGPSAFRVCSLRDQPGLSGPLVDPLGGAEVHQRVCPLNRRLERFGEVPPKDHDRFDLKAVSPDPKPPSYRLVQDHFAPSQFEALTEADRLSRPGFEKMDAGVSLLPQAIAVGGAIGDTVSFDTTIVDAPDGVTMGDPSYLPQSSANYTLPAARQAATLGGSAGGRSPLLNSGEERYAPPPDHEVPAALADEAFLIVERDSLARAGDFPNPIVGKSAALQALREYLDEHAESRGRLGVVPQHEALVA